jgi:hypothetical protein
MRFFLLASAIAIAFAFSGEPRRIAASAGEPVAAGAAPPAVMPAAAAPSPACAAATAGTLGAQVMSAIAERRQILRDLAARIRHPFEGRLADRAVCTARRSACVVRGLVGFRRR